MAVVCCRYTSDAAYGIFWEDGIGSLAPGKLADMVVLSSNPMETIEIGPLPQVLKTYVGGKLVYDKDGEERFL